MTHFKAPLIIRGRIIEDDDAEFGGRSAETRFRGPDVAKYVNELPLSPPWGA